METQASELFIFEDSESRLARANGAVTWRFATSCETRMAAGWSSTSASRNVMGVAATPCKMGT